MYVEGKIEKKESHQAHKNQNELKKSCSGGGDGAKAAAVVAANRPDQSGVLRFD